MLSRCPLCAQPGAPVFLRRMQVPVHQNLVMASEAEARGVARGDLAMAACGHCGFVYNAAFDPARMHYSEDYDNTQGCSGVFARHMEALAEHLVNERGVRDASIVEIGCGKGDFLRLLIERHPGNSGIGFDPSYAGALSALGGRLQFEQRNYGPQCAGLKADVVVCRHVIEHVPQPLELLGAVKAALQQAPQARLFFETPCVDWILRHGVIWDFFYEHCSLFSAASLAQAFRGAGLRVGAVRHLFEGQYLWLEASLAGSDDFVALRGTPTPELATRFASQFDASVTQWSARMAQLRREGRVAIWGAGAKGATFVELVDRGRERIDCVVDINPNKQGRYIPGSGHPIVAPRELAGRGVAAAVMMNPNYLAEAEAYLTREGIATRLLI